jgi:formylglycine-generating enzyme required for sulfatase activity
VEGSSYLGDDFPVIQISWEDCREFLDWADLTFPSEAQWESACRAGTTTIRYWGDDQDGAKTCRYANVADVSMEALYEVTDMGYECSDGWGFISPVGNYLPNSFGLYDMLGNVWEFCLDEYHKGYYALSAKRDPVNRNGEKIQYTVKERVFLGYDRVCRGGCWCNSPRRTRCAVRDRLHPTDRSTTQGFRACKAGS